MKKSINAWAADPNATSEELFRTIGQAGFESIELNVDGAVRAKSALSMDTTAEELAEFAELSRQYRLSVGSISTSLWARYPMGDPAYAEKAAQLLEQQLKCASALGATGILVVPGERRAGFTLRQTWENCVQFLRSQKDMIHQYGVQVGLENVWNAFFTSPFDMKRFLEEVDNPLVKCYYDVGNTVAFSVTEDWIDILGSDICKVHIKDFRRNENRINAGGDFVDLTEGSIDWEKTILALRQAGYDGTLTAEVSKSDPNESYAAFYRRVRTQEDTILSYIR